MEPLDFTPDGDERRGNGNGADAGSHLLAVQITLLRDEIAEHDRRQDDRMTAVERESRRLNDQQLSVLAGVQAALTATASGVGELANRVTHNSYVVVGCIVVSFVGIVISALHMALR